MRPPKHAKPAPTKLIKLTSISFLSLLRYADNAIWYADAVVLSNITAKTVCQALLD